MGLAMLLARKDGHKGSGGLGLGWIIGIAICGGILFFAALGYLLVWRLRQTKKPITRRVYATDDPGTPENGDPPTGFLSKSRQRLTSSSTMVLSKRFMQSQSSLGRISSHLSLNNMTPWKPPILPPLPTHISGDPRRRTSDPANWELEQERAPSEQKGNLGRWRESLFGRDSWMALMMMGNPTLPHLEMEEQDKEEEQRREIKMIVRDGSEEDVTKQEEIPMEPPKPIPQEEPQKNELHVQKKRNSNPSPTLGSSQTTPELSSQHQQEDNPPRGRPRVVGHMQQPPQLPPPRESEKSYQQMQQYYCRQRMRASATETDLKVILKSTEQRLRDGSSRSPVKNEPRASQSKERRPQTKTPSPSRSVGPMTPSPSRSMRGMTPSPSKRGLRTPTSVKSAGRMTPSPSEMNLNQGAGNLTKTHSRSLSIGSLSAAHSLINLAAAELGSPASSKGSPNRPRSKEWGRSARQESQQSLKQQQQKSPQRQQQPQQQQRQQQKPQQQQQSRKQQRRRSMSSGSDVSSCLSTLYSVGETEEDEVVIAARYDDDPFAETKRMHQQTHPNGPRPLRRTKTVGARGFSDEEMDASAMPAPLRTISVNSHLGRTGRPQSAEKRNSMRLSVVLDPPNKTAASEDVKPKVSKLEPPKRNSLVEAASETSILSDVSVYTDASVSDVSDDTIMGDELPRPRSRSTTSSTKSTPAKSTRSMDMSSSPMDDRDLIAILRDSTRPRRDLPMPPSKITLNDDENGIITPLSPQPKNRQPSRPPSRRGSITSIGSSIYDDHDDGPSALPGRALGSAVLSAAHSVGSTVAQLRRMNSVISSYSVASVASTVFGDTVEEDPALPSPPSLRGGGFSPDRTMSKNEASGRKNYLNLSPDSKGSLSPTRRSRHARTPSLSGSPVRKATKSDNKENHGRTVRFDVPSPVTLRDGTNLPPPTTSPSRITGMRSQRASVESLGLYDQDGFLVGSPERDLTALGGRLRM